MSGIIIGGTTMIVGTNPQQTQKCLAGTELKKLLHKIGINPEGACPCKQRAIVMDREGCDWCETNIETIVNWLQEEAKRRKLPFVRAAGKLLVRRAIHNARRNQAKQQ